LDLQAAVQVHRQDRQGHGGGVSGEIELR
jgi:hypothetical protein